MHPQSDCISIEEVAVSEQVDLTEAKSAELSIFRKFASYAKDAEDSGQMPTSSGNPRGNINSRRWRSGDQPMKGVQRDAQLDSSLVAPQGRSGGWFPPPTSAPSCRAVFPRTAFLFP
jgi:hypothetical protein